MDILPLLKILAIKNGSDLFLIPGARPVMKADNRLISVGDRPLAGEDIETAAVSLMDEGQAVGFRATWECNLALSVPEVGRFRINVFRQRGSTSMVVRYIKSAIPSIEELHLPSILKDLVLLPRGLILVVGAAGSGKSTTLATMIDHRNREKAGHILTIEDPIEYTHKHKRSLVSQREVGLDTKSFDAALINAMRESPDVIMIGEIRDMATMQHAIAYAETGHLCLSTLHANNANQALDRIVNFFPDSAHRQIRMDLSLNLKAVVSQRLIPGKDGAPRVPAVEVMLLSKYVSELILKGEVHAIKEAMQDSDLHGMRTFDQSLFELYEQGRISREQALEHADSPNDLSLRIRMGTAQVKPRTASWAS